MGRCVALFFRLAILIPVTSIYVSIDKAWNIRNNVKNDYDKPK